MFSRLAGAYGDGSSTTTSGTTATATATATIDIGLNSDILSSSSSASLVDHHQARSLAFPNSRLDSLAHAPNHHQLPHHHHHNHNHDTANNHDGAQLLSATDTPTATPTVAAAADATLSHGNQLITPQWIGVAPTSSTGSSGHDMATDVAGSAAAAAVADDTDWWSNAIEEDTFESPLAFDASENGLWNGRFVPPPPRPPFLDESVAADGLTTCDLCTWAWQRNAYSLDGSMNPSGEIGWTFTLIIVSIISALIGAIVMVIFLRCRRIKSGNGNGGRQQAWWCRNNRNNSQNTRSSLSIKHPTDSIRRPTSNSGVWTWLGSRRSSAGPDQIGPPSSSPAENHYTHMDDAYSPVGASEALYAELDRESVRSANPSYQNTAYSQCEEKYNFQQHEQDIPMVVSSAPSSAYYSDLSVTAMPGGGGNERAYEVVGLTVMSQPLPHWDTGGGHGSSGGVVVAGPGTAAASTSGGGAGSSSSPSTSAAIMAGEAGGVMASQRRIPRLAAINETSTTTVPSDYV